MARTRFQVLGLHPTSRGFGWIVLEDARSFLDWGTVDVRADFRNAGALARIESLMERVQPDVLALEAHKDAIARRSQRIRRLYLAIVGCAESRNIIVYRCSRSQITNSSLLKGARTRQQVAAAVAERLDALRPHLPKPRRLWVGEQSGMRVFCAAACALTYLDEVAFNANTPPTVV